MVNIILQMEYVVNKHASNADDALSSLVLFDNLHIIDTLVIVISSFHMYLMAPKVL